MGGGERKRNEMGEERMKIEKGRENRIKRGTNRRREGETVKKGRYKRSN